MTNKFTQINPASLTSTFDDEFNTFNASPNGSSTGWMTQYPFSGAERTLSYTHEAEYLSDPSTGVNPFKLVNGVLDITATVAAPGSNPLNLPYNSGAITTYKSFAQLYGYFEIRAELPAGQGLWPAFWMLPVNGQSVTELDIFEVLGNAPNVMHSTVHSSTAADTLSQALSVANTSTGFHSYGVDWEPKTITFYMDGQAIAAVATPPDMNVPMYMLLSLAVGGAGSWPGATNSSTPFPATMQLDYVRAYATAATVGVSNPNPPTPAAVLPTVQAAAAAGTSWLGVTVSNYAGGNITGVGVALLNATGQVVATTITGSNGTAKFTGLAAGTYQIQYIPQASLMLQVGSQANAATGLTAPVKLGAGQGYYLTHETVVSTASITGSVQLAGAAQAGVTVSLLNASNAVVETTTTDSQGNFSLYGPAGTYTVHYSAPAGTGPLIGSHADPVSGISPRITVVSGQNFLLTPEVLVANPASLSGSVAFANGTTTAEAGVTVTLVSAGGTTVATATTGSNGTFNFAGIAAGNYQLQYAGPVNTVPGANGAADPTTGLTAAFTLAGGQVLSLPTETLVTAPATLSGSVVFATGVATGEAGEAVALLSSSGSTIATTTTNGSGAFSFTNLAAGSYQVQYAALANEVIASGPGSTSTGLTGTLVLAIGQTLTLGAEAMAGTLGTITGSTLFGSAAQAGDTVTLMNGAGTTALATATTSANGTYHFTGLTAGYYQVQYLPPAGDAIQGGPVNATTGLTGAFSVAAGSSRALGPVTFATAPTATLNGAVVLAGAGAAGVAVNLVNAAGAIAATTLTDTNGNYHFANVAAGSYQVGYTALANTVLGAASAANASTGLTSAFTLSAGQVLSVPTETLAPAPASLSGNVVFTNGTTAAEPGATVTLLAAGGTAVASTTTDANGNFGFTGLAAGSYQLDYTALANTVLGAASAADPTTGLTSAFTLSAGQVLSLPTETFAPAPASLSGNVVFTNGTTAAEPGATVTLLAAGGTAVASTTTDANGNFGFTGLAAGSYQLDYTALANTVLGAASAANASTGLTSAFTLSAGQVLSMPTETFSPVLPAALSGAVLFTANASAATVGDAGITVSLLTATGSLAASARTAANGQWSFAGLTPGSYEVHYALAAAQALQSGPALVNGTTAAIALGSGQALTLANEQLTTAPSSITGTVLHYGQGDANTAQSGVNVTLLNAAGATVATAVTAGNGTFTFSNLAAGTYQVSEAAPSWAVFQARSADAGPGLSAMVTVKAGQQLALTHETLLSTSNSFTETGVGATALRGSGNYTVTGDASTSSLTLGAGNQSVSLTGSGNTVTTGAGSSTISVGPGSTVHAAGGLINTTSITATGGGNLLDVASGMGFLQTDGSAGNVVLTDAAGQGQSTISGFNMNSTDVLDLARTLAGINVGPGLQGIGSYVTATNAGGNTMLSVDPTGGQGAGTVFATLTNTTATVDQLLAGNHFSMA